jgi:hypothetical protein
MAAEAGQVRGKVPGGANLTRLPEGPGPIPCAGIGLRPVGLTA